MTATIQSTIGKCFEFINQKGPILLERIPGSIYRVCTKYVHERLLFRLKLAKEGVAVVERARNYGRLL